MSVSALLALASVAVLQVAAMPAGQYPNEVLFFAHCRGGSDQGTLMAYYQNGPGYPNGKMPDAWAPIQAGTQLPWEGTSYTGTFQWQGAGTKATSKINSNAASLSRHQFAGTATNSWGQAFNCYKDSDTWLFQCAASPTINGMGTDCYSGYWCYDAN